MNGQSHKSHYQPGEISRKGVFHFKLGGLAYCRSCHRFRRVQIVEVGQMNNDEFVVISSFHRCYSCCEIVQRKHPFSGNGHKPPAEPPKENRNGKASQATIDRVAQLIQQGAENKHKIAIKLCKSEYTVEKAVKELRRANKVSMLMNGKHVVYFWNEGVG